MLSFLMLVTSVSPAFLYAEENVEPVAENIIPVVETQEDTSVIPISVVDIPVTTPAPVSIVPENPTPVTIPVVETIQPTTSSVVAIEDATIVTAAPVSTPTNPVIPVVTPAEVDQNNDEEALIEEIVDEEVDMEDIDLWNDTAELDALKDFTAIVRQSKDYTCGPASLATLLTQLGTDTSEQTILDSIAPSDINETQGTTLLALRSASQVLENTTYLKKWDAKTVLKYIQMTGDPVLIHDEKKDVGGHFSVIKSYDAEQWIVELSDTEAGNIKYSVEDFEHIYTGHALVISSGLENELLNDPTTTIEDAEAATIWGKYVPVVMYAQKNGYTTAVNTFRTCINRALSFKSVVERNYERQICYNALASTLGSTMNNTTELGFIASYNASYINPGNHEHLYGEFGLNAMVSILTQKLNENKALLSTKQSTYNTKFNTYNTLVEGNPGLKSKVDAYNKAISDKTLLTNSINSKNTSITTLNREISSGAFVQNNASFSLWAVGNQVVAQQSNYNRISQSLASTISSLTGQINTAQRSLNNANGSYNYWNGQYSAHMSSYNSYSSAYNDAIKNRDYFYNLYYYGRNGRTTSNWNNYQGWIAKANAANINKNRSYNDAQRTLWDRNYWSWQIITYSTQVNSLTAKKNTEQAKVDRESAELSRLQKLKAFGDAEMQRKRWLVMTLTQEVSALNTQLTKTNKDIADLPTVINLLRSQLQSNYSSLAYELTVLRSDITVLQSEIDRQVQEVANEAKFEKNADNVAEIAATKDYRNFVDTNTKALLELSWYDLDVAIQVPVNIITLTYQDGKQCFMNWGVQQCLSTCWVAGDVTGIWFPVAMACDAVNGSMYLFQWDKVAAGASLLAIIPFAGSPLKQSTRGTLKLSGEAAQVVAKQAGKTTSNIATKIARGHAFTKHISDFSSLGIRTSDQLASHADSIMNKVNGTSNMKYLERWRKAYWDDSTSTIVISDPNHVDLWTMFRPTAGKKYFNEIK